MAYFVLFSIYAFLVKQIQYYKSQHPQTNIPIFRTHKTDRLGKWSISTVLKFPRPVLGRFFSILDNLRLAALMQVPERAISCRLSCLNMSQLIPNFCELT